MLDAVSKALACLGGAIFLGCAGLVAIDIILRALFTQTTLYSVELTAYGFAIAVACGYGYSLRAKTHIRINIVYRVLPAGVRAVLDFLAIAGMAAMAVALATYAVELTLDNLAMGSRSTTTLAMPLYLPQAVWAIGLGWFALVAVLLALKVGRALIRGRLAEIEDAVGLKD